MQRWDGAEAPVVVVKELKTKEFIGGAGIVTACESTRCKVRSNISCRK